MAGGARAHRGFIGSLTGFRVRTLAQLVHWGAGMAAAGLLLVVLLESTRGDPRVDNFSEYLEVLPSPLRLHGCQAASCSGECTDRAFMSDTVAWKLLWLPPAGSVTGGCHQPQVIGGLTPQMVGYSVMVLGFSCMILVRLIGCPWRQTPVVSHHMLTSSHTEVSSQSLNPASKYA